jgi:hypothetical protein
MASLRAEANPQREKRIMSGLKMRLGVLALISGAAVMMAAPAYARCDAPRVIYKFSKGTPSTVTSQVVSHWVRGPSKSTVITARTGKVEASLSATLHGEVDAIVAKAGLALGTTLTAGMQVSTSESHPLVVPAGKKGRIALVVESQKFKVTKKTLQSNCRYLTAYSGKVVNIPEKRGDVMVARQLKKLPPGRRELQGAQAESEQSDSRDDGSFEEQTILAVVPQGKADSTP